MAAMPLASFRPTAGIRASALPEDAAAGMRKGSSRKPSSAGSNWWTPIFGFGSGGADYITGSTSSSPSTDNNSPSVTDNDGTARGVTARAAIAASAGEGRMPPAAVVFTDEKARMLRMKTAEASSFHDIMYHSAIASRLASDFQGHGPGERTSAR